MASLVRRAVGSALTGWLVCTPMTTAAESMSRLWSPTYEWSATFVGVDRDAKTLTVKSWVLGGHDARLALDTLQAGEPIVVVWSGAFEHASGVRDVVRSDASAAAVGRFQLPATFVAGTTVGPRRYVTFTVPVSDDMLDTVTSLEPGDWITVTARHRPPREAEAIVAVTPFASGHLYAANHDRRHEVTQPLAPATWG